LTSGAENKQSPQGIEFARMTPRQLQPVFIVGQYKCGTTWLLRILSTHPHVIGVAEINVVKAACDFKWGAAVLAPIPERLSRFFDKSMWCNTYNGGAWAYTDVIARFQRGETIPARPWQRSEPRKFMHLSSQSARGLYEKIVAAIKPEDAMEAFLEAVCSDAQEETHVVLKAADQISRLATLNAWQPTAKKIVIIRDGRDAAISATHFQQWLRANKPMRGMPRSADYWKLLHSWANHADMAIAAAARHQIYLLRYEDLSENFVATMQPLFQWLGLAASKSLVESLEARTSFEALTGRSRGIEAKAVMRKGVVGEWRESLLPDEQERAWRMAGDQLRALGYTHDGTRQELPDLSKLEEQPYRFQRTIELDERVTALRTVVSRLEAELCKKTRSRPHRTLRIQSVVHAVRNLGKHFARLLISFITVGIPTCNDALRLDAWLDAYP
jgi:Sulfotransferase domain